MAKRSAAEIAAAMMGGGSTKTKPAAKPAPKVAVKAAPKVAAKPAAKPAAKSGKGASLGELQKLAEAGDFDRVLGALLAVWRAAPSRPLGDIIVKVGERARTSMEWMPKGVPPATAIPSLLETLNAKGSKQGMLRLEAMATWPSDPRIDRWIAERYNEVPYTSTGARPWWTRLLPLASRIIDPAASEALAQARTKRGQHDWVREYLDRIRTQIGEVADPPLAAETRAAIASLEKAATPKQHKHADTAAELLAAVLAKPDDEQARLVLADALMELGHPRGELIALQLEGTRRELTAAEKKREKEIIKSHRVELLGTLDGAIKPECTFAKGFLTRAALRQDGSGKTEAAIAKCAGDPLWSTVEHLEGPEDWDITRHPVMRSLRSIRSTDVDTEWLAKHPRLEVIAGEKLGDKWLPLLDRGFPALRELEVTTYVQHVAPLLKSKLGKQLQRLKLRFSVAQGQPGTEVFALIPTLWKSAIADVTLEFEKYDSYNWASGIRLTRDGSSRAIAIYATNIADNWEQYVVEDMLRALDQVAALAPTSIEIAKNLRVKEHAKRVDDRVKQILRG
jgi:uncharacterized protein (TIGR02996 family)